MLVERLAERPWATDILERFAKPLGLDDTRNCATAPLIPRRVQGYEALGQQWRNADFLAMSQPFSAGALCSTVGDLARWNIALHGGRVVSAESYRRMTTPEGAAKKANYGFGLVADTALGHRMIAHGGGIHGFTSSNAWFPDDGLSVTVLVNSGGSRAADPLLKNLARVALGVPLPVPPRRVTLSGADLARYTGVYALPLPNRARDFTFFARGDTLFAQIEGQPANPLIAYENHTFGTSFDPDLRITFTLENGRATRVALLQNGRRTEGARK